MKNRGVRWLGEGTISHFLTDFTSKGFIGSSVLIAHRPGVSDWILYDLLLHKAQFLYKAVIIFPLQEPLRLPSNISSISIDIDDINKKQYRKGKIYRFLPHSLDLDKEKDSLEEFYCKTLLSKKRTYPYVVIIDTLKKWHPVLEDHLRLLIREAPLSNGSIWIHCPLSIVPPDLLSVFGNVMVVWPSQNEIDLLNIHFPAEKIPPPSTDTKDSSHSYMLVFNSKPIDERGWAWKKFSPNN